MRVETETVTGQDAAEASTEKTEQVATEIDEPDDIGDAENTVHIVESEEASSEGVETEDAEDVEPQARWRQIKWSRVLAFGVLPVVALVIAAAAGGDLAREHHRVVCDGPKFWQSVYGGSNVLAHPWAFTT